MLSGVFGSSREWARTRPAPASPQCGSWSCDSRERGVVSLCHGSVSQILVLVSCAKIYQCACFYAMSSDILSLRDEFGGFGRNRPWLLVWSLFLSARQQARRCRQCPPRCKLSQV